MAGLPTARTTRQPASARDLIFEQPVTKTSSNMHRRPKRRQTVCLDAVATRLRKDSKFNGTTMIRGWTQHADGSLGVNSARARLGKIGGRVQLQHRELRQRVREHALCLPANCV